MPPHELPSPIKKIYLAVAVLLLCAGAFALWVYPGIQTSTETPPTESSLTLYTNADYKIAFSYPDTYTLESHDIDITGMEGVSLVLMPKGVTLPEAGEGPPTVTVAIFKNLTQIPLAEWIQTVSGMIPPTDGWDYTEVSVGREEAIAYTATGLYESDNVVVARGGYIYLFSASWLTREDATLKDLATLLSTVSFTK